MTRAATPCKAPAIKGAKRCRMHGGKGSGAPQGNRNARKHGARSSETLRAERHLRLMTQMLSNL
ncbi:HGGxSTG domain-containing protein [Sphingomonas piscis]|uniref:HGGxSTG domain-containing protein n=1 Tax=Sphingomonas piscis TaxID=2714943 RepID=UPI003CCD1308